MFGLVLGFLVVGTIATPVRSPDIADLSREDPANPTALQAQPQGSATKESGANPTTSANDAGAQGEVVGKQKGTEGITQINNIITDGLKTAQEVAVNTSASVKTGTDNAKHQTEKGFKNADDAKAKGGETTKLPDQVGSKTDPPEKPDVPEVPKIPEPEKPQPPKIPPIPGFGTTILR
eukprot:c21092_g1_i1.p1 GENE.c21092_g1_i1~~c21092_g1_i1.p1  ORF type:complete len:185 (+),score=36.79 c21092_g1_i1:22-555(+)